MKITIAKTAGFCMGVRRAVDMVLDAANNTSEPISTYGPLIHNPQVLKMLEEKGIPTIHHIPERGEGTILIRAHGVPPDEHKALQNAGFKVINATCPRVIRVQTIIRKHAAKGFVVIIIGDKDHPEVKGLMGYAKMVSNQMVCEKMVSNQIVCEKMVSNQIVCEKIVSNQMVCEKMLNNNSNYVKSMGYTVSGVEELSLLPLFDQAIVVAQTTQDTALYNNVKQWTIKHHPHYKIFDTICDSTEKRQSETRKIAKESDVVVVVGGKDSGNTRRLAQIASETVTLHIEDVSELDMSQLASAKSIAITAGASTPNWIISQTCRAIEHAYKKKENSPEALIQRFRDFMLKSNFFLSAGAGSLTYACSKLQGISTLHGIDPNFIFDLNSNLNVTLNLNLINALVAMLYVLSMQILNNLFSIKSDKYNNPERAEFYESHKIALTITAIASGAAGLCLSFTTGILPFAILCFMSVLGLLYNQKVFPDFLPSFYLWERRIIRIKDIPGSKTILISAAWGTVTCLLPALSIDRDVVLIDRDVLFSIKIFGIFLIPFVFATAIIFARTAFFAILEIQGDRITGKETIPIILGEKKSLKLIQNMLLLASSALFLSALAGLISMSGILIAVIPLSMLYVIKLNKDGKINSGMHLDFIIESHFLFAGIITLFF